VGSVPITGEVVVLFLVVLGAVGGFWWRIEARFSGEDMVIGELKKELAEYKLYVERNHVSAQVLRDLETRVVNAIEKLATRLEAIADRLDERQR